MQSLTLRPEFLAKHPRASAIELSNQQNSGWAQRPDATELLDITYPTSDVQRALEAVSTVCRRAARRLHRSARSRQVPHHGLAAPCLPKPGGCGSLVSGLGHPPPIRTAYRV